MTTNNPQATKKIHKRTLKESEELVASLQKKLWHSQEVLQEMRMALYYVNLRLSEIHSEMDGMWFHHLDGSDLLVTREELFSVFQNKLLPSVNKCKSIIGKPLSRLKEFIGW